jgi:hypothetical protein
VKPWRDEMSADVLDGVLAAPDHHRVIFENDVAHWSECLSRRLPAPGTSRTPTSILAAFAPGGVPAIRLSRRAAQRGAGMPKIVVTAAVKDVEAWLKFKPQLIAQMSAVASDGTSYVAMDGSNRVATTWDVPDMEAFQAAQSAASPEMAAAMERYGMIPPATVYIEK